MMRLWLVRKRVLDVVLAVGMNCGLVGLGRHHKQMTSQPTAASRLSSKWTLIKQAHSTSSAV